MQPTTTLLSAVGSIAALAADYTATRTGWHVDIRTECLCWATLAMGLWAHRYIRSKQSKPNEEQMPSSLDRMAWAVSICIASARIIPIYYDVSAALSLATVAVFLYSHLVARSSGALPGPGSKTLGLSTMREASKGRMQLVKPVTFVLLGIWCCFLFKPDLNKTNGLHLLVLFVFVMVRMAAFVLLDSTCRDHDLSLPDNQDAFFKVVNAIVFRTFAVITGVMVAFPPPIDIAWPVALQAGCSAAKLAVNFYLVLLGAMVSATTIDAYSAAAIQSLVAKATRPAVSFSTASIVSLVQGVLGLPSSSAAARRRIFLVFTAIPALSLYVSCIVLARPGFQLSPSVHPIEHLAAEADVKFHQMLNRQSQTLEDACAEYQRRYRRQPPANFDKWFLAARDSNFLLIDEFDTMMAALEPLWGVPAADVRGRVEYALNAGHMSMIRFEVTNHAISYSMENFADWMASQMYNWLDQDMLNTLPDMVFAVNTRDEPKVVVPHDSLASALNKSQAGIAHSQDNAEPGRDHDRSQRVDFLEVGKQNAWDAMSISCPPDSPARDFAQTAASATLSDFGFLSNVTMSKDVCQFPGLRDLHAMLLSPESLSMTHSLVPIFSQAKISSFQDVLYPSPWYAAKLDMHEYEEDEDLDWDQKENMVYWTGSNTGGHSTMDNWRSFQRQRLTMMATDLTRPITLLGKTLEPRRGGSYDHKWEPVNSTIKEISPAMRVRVSAVIQCEQDACDDQQSAFGVETEIKDDVSASYGTRYNLDLDGNGFSGRFYRLLRSKSAVLKQTLYKEWHDDWLIPWVHYIPISMDLTDLPETVRYLTQEPEGQELGKKVAEGSQEWTKKVLRKQDMKLAFWRLLLEYGRALDDNREQMNCCSP